MTRLAWFWTDVIGRRAPWVGYAAGLAVGVLSYAISLALAWRGGEARTFLADPRWLVGDLIVGLCAIQLVIVPRAIERLWDSLGPLLADPANELPRLRAATRRLLARCFPYAAIVWLGFVAMWVANGSWGEHFRDERLAVALNLISGLVFVVYFQAGAASFSTIGLWLLVRRLAKDTEFRPGALVAAGRTALKPFNQILWRAWLFSLVIVLLVGLVTAPPTGRVVRVEDVFLWIVIAILMALVFSAQRAMNGLLSRERTRDLTTLRKDIDLERQAATGESIDVLRSLHRVQILLHDLRRAETFSPTLVDTHFVVQISLSVSATLIANVLLRTVLVRVLGP